MYFIKSLFFFPAISEIFLFILVFRVKQTSKIENMNFKAIKMKSNYDSITVLIKFDKYIYINIQIVASIY